MINLSHYYPCAGQWPTLSIVVSGHIFPQQWSPTDPPSISQQYWVLYGSTKWIKFHWTANSSCSLACWIEPKNKIPLQVFLRAPSNLPNHWKHKTEQNPVSVEQQVGYRDVCLCVCVRVCVCTFSLLSPSKSHPLSLSINVFLLHTEEKSSQLYQLKTFKLKLNQENKTKSTSFYCVY